jgi:hypothetical protein
MIVLCIALLLLSVAGFIMSFSVFMGYLEIGKHETAIGYLFVMFFSILFFVSSVISLSHAAKLQEIESAPSLKDCASASDPRQGRCTMVEGPRDSGPSVAP